MFGFQKLSKDTKKKQYGKPNRRLFSLFFHDFRSGFAKRI